MKKICAIQHYLSSWFKQPVADTRINTRDWRQDRHWSIGPKAAPRVRRTQL